MQRVDQDVKRRLLQRHFLFRELTTPEIDELLTYARVERVRANETIFLKGSPGTGLMAVLQGEVRISVPGFDGRQITLTTFGDGEIFGEIALLDGGERTADATAITNVELLAIDRRSFLPFLERHPKIATKLLVALCARLRRTTEQVEDLALLDLPARLAKKLLGIAGAKGVKTARGIRISAALTQSELANMVGTSRESINRQLARWQRDGIVHLAQGAITITDAAALQRIVDAD